MLRQAQHEGLLQLYGLAQTLTLSLSKGEGSPARSFYFPFNTAVAWSSRSL